MWYLANVRTETGYLDSYEYGETIAEVIDMMRKLHGPKVSVSVRKIAGPEWDCDNWTIAGHIPHEKKEG